MPEPRKLPAEYPDDEPEELDLTGEELDTQVQRAQEQLSDLRRRQEQIEKEKLRLEELSRRQEEFEVGCAEMTEKFHRSLSTLQREIAESQRRTEQLESIDESFTRHLRELQAMNPKAWSGADLPKELTKALGGLEEARAAYAKLSPKIEAESIEHGVAGSPMDYEEMYAGGNGEKSFVYWLMAGFGFTLPLFALGVIALALLLWKLWSGQ